ncbi:secreted protein containing Peptidase M23 domain protein [Candidatus Magnetobacterium bavaricum]|uniref:Secreted protein containing Peptidase M23 domain protein n=1 Tax=Candidatus Magnetobacterium bavaricum TaxID=29290 RepID=A0A0F3GYH4_9BACT|nr:secreted protein containing Peptidase M23 domain protein [Candidatus Magnetobacterium bavaricum]
MKLIKMFKGDRKMEGLKRLEIGLMMLVMVVLLSVPMMSQAEEGSPALPEINYPIEDNNLVVALGGTLDTINSAMVKEGPVEFEEIKKDTSTLASVDIYNLQTIPDELSHMELRESSGETFGLPTTVPEGHCSYGNAKCLSGGHHTSIDYAGPDGGIPRFAAVATNSGTVVEAELLSSNDHGMGNNVIIKHDNGIYSSYSHLASIDSKIKKGAPVSKGQTIGIIGSSGYGDSYCYLKGKATSSKCKGKKDVNVNNNLHFEMKTCGKSSSCSGKQSWGFLRARCRCDFQPVALSGGLLTPFMPGVADPLPTPCCDKIAARPPPREHGPFYARPPLTHPP